MTQPWFHSGLTREQTHELFAKKGMVDGMFIIRESQRIPAAYVLSFSFNQKVKHYQINAVSKLYLLQYHLFSLYLTPSNIISLTNSQLFVLIVSNISTFCLNSSLKALDTFGKNNC